VATKVAVWQQWQRVANSGSVATSGSVSNSGSVANSGSVYHPVAVCQTVAVCVKQWQWQCVNQWQCVKQWQCAKHWQCQALPLSLPATHQLRHAPVLKAPVGQVPPHDERDAPLGELALGNAAGGKWQWQRGGWESVKDQLRRIVDESKAVRMV
jgi:hypothetical protein